MVSFVAIPDPFEVEADLVPRRTLGDPSPGDRLVRRVSIGRSDAVRLTPGHVGVTPELAAFLGSESVRHIFFLVSLTCSFRPADAPIVEAVLGVSLRRSDTQPQPLPIAWSLEPLKAATRVKYGRTTSLTAKATFLPQALGFDAEREGGVEWEKEEWFVVAAGEGEPDAEWHFRATRAADLVGVQRLALVARVPAGTAATGLVGLSAKVRHGRLGILHYRADLPPHAQEIVFDP